jgi:hypothetical protein
MANEDYERKRQEFLDRIEWQKAQGKAGEAKQHILPPGAVLTDEFGKELMRNPLAEKAEKDPTGDALLVSKLSDPNLPPEEREYWEGIYQDKIRPPAGPTINIPGPEKMQFVTKKNGETGFFHPVTGQYTKIDDPPAPGAPEPRQLTAEELKQKDAAERAVVAGDNIKSNIARAQELNPGAASGPLAPLTKYFDMLTNPPKYHASQELENVVMNNVVTSLKDAFGGSGITNDERKALADVQGSLSQPVEVRKEIYERAARVAAAAVERNKKKAADISAGTYGTTNPSNEAKVRKYNPQTQQFE